jgi:hypothetical protein
MKYFIVFIALLISIASFAQSPQSFKYQAVVRDNNGNVLVNKIVSIRTSILQSSTSGASVYTETQNIATNDFGVVAINIGQGNLISGNFATINWGADIYFIKTEVDLTGGSNYQFMGTSQLMSVPYALYAAKSGASKNDLDTSATNEIQTLNLNGRNLSISGGNNIQLPDDNDGDNTNEIQTLSINDHTVSISNSNSVVIPDNQVLSLNSNILSISNGNTIVLPPDSDANPTNEIQALSLINDTLYLSNGGFVNMLPFKDNTDNQQLSISGNQLQISGGNSITITGAVDLDADPTNELQYLNKSGDTLYLSQGNYVIIPPDADHDPTNELQTITVTGDSIKISNGGGAIKIPTPTNAIVPSGTCIYSFDKNPPAGYYYSGEKLLPKKPNWNVLFDTISTGLMYSSNSHYCVLNGKLYNLVQTTNISPITFKLFEIDLTTGAYSIYNSNHTFRDGGGLSGASLCTDGSNIFLIGGGSTSSSRKIVDMFDVSSKIWSRISDYPFEIYYTFSTNIGDKIVFVGSNNTNHSPYLSLFNPQTQNISYYNYNNNNLQVDNTRFSLINDTLIFRNNFDDNIIGFDFSSQTFLIIKNNMTEYYPLENENDLLFISSTNIKNLNDEIIYEGNNMSDFLSSNDCIYIFSNPTNIALEINTGATLSFQNSNHPNNTGSFWSFKYNGNIYKIYWSNNGFDVLKLETFPSKYMHCAN